MRGRQALRALAALAILLPASWPALAARGATADFKPADYVVTLDGKPVDAKVWQSRIAGEMVIDSIELGGPIRLVLREARAETLMFMKVDRRPDGGLTLLPDAADRSLGTFKVSEGGKGVTFDLDGSKVELTQKPPLLGDQDLAGLKAYSRDYARLAEQYKPSKAFLESLRSESRAVRVEVYFGTWCPFCQEMVPRIMRVAEELEGSKIQVEFYGLPQAGFSQDPKARALNLTGVPTGVVYVGDREVGRIKTNGWKIPELTINRFLVKSSS